jgi:hypothetical protein
MRVDLNQFFLPSLLTVNRIAHIALPRLDWQDREFDTIQRAQKILPRKIILAGEYLEMRVNKNGGEAKHEPFLMLLDHWNLKNS